MTERHAGMNHDLLGSHLVAPGLRELLDASPDLLFACDADGALLWLSRAFETLTGRVAADQIGRRWSTLVVPHEVRRVARLFLRQRRRRTPVAEVALPLLASQGREVWVAARVSLLERPDGGLIFVGTARSLESGTDVAAPEGAPAADTLSVATSTTPATAVIHAAAVDPRPRGGLAAALSFLSRGARGVAPGTSAAPASAGADPARLHGEHAALARQVQQLTTERDEARARAQAKGELLASMTHEIRTPMNGMMGMAHLLLESELDPDQRGMVEVLLHAGEVLLDLVNDTLDFSRVESGKLELERLPFDLRVTTNEAAALLAPLANEKGLHFECEVHHEVPSLVWGDPGRLRQVLLNLGGNAVKFTERGRVRLAVDRLREDENGVTLRFALEDTGIGMSKEQEGRIFQAFQQADASIARRYGGTGLGLAISSLLVSLMGGTVGVESAPDQGSTFWFDITLEKQSDAAPGPEAAPSRTELSGLRVMVVEPSLAMRRSYLLKLEAWGCRVESAENAEVGLVMLQEAAEAADPFRLALIERQLPGMDGEEMGAAIRADAACDRTLTVLVTSAGRRGDAARARARGFSAYLSKPLDWEPLAGVLAEVLHRAEAAPAGRTPELITLHSMAESRRSRLRILLVEDSAVNQVVTQWTLKRLGYGLQIAPTVRAALEAWEREPFDLVLMDIQLPDGDGYALARELRSRERADCRVPIVAMTGSAEPGDREKCLAAGMDEYLPKPVDLGLLCRLVETLTGGGGAAGAEADVAVPSRDDANDPGRVAAAVDDTTLLREIETAEAEMSGVQRHGARGDLGASAGLARESGVPPTGFAMTRAAQILETEQAMREQRPAEAVVAAQAEPRAVAAARVAGLIPTVDSLSSADVMPLDDGEPLRDEVAGDVPRPALDLARLEEASMGIPALRESLLNTFLTDVRPRLERLGLAVNGRDPRRIEFEAHGLKGMCLTLGATTCAELFAELERMGREQELNLVPPTLKRAYLEVTRTERFITAMERLAA